MSGSCLEESYTAQNSLELNSLPGPPHHSMQNKELSHLKEKKMDIKVDCPAPSWSQPLADLQNSLPQPFKR